VIYIVIYLLIDTLITGVFLWVGMKLVAMFMGMSKGAVYCTYWQLVLAAGASALAGLIPDIGWALSLLVLFGLMMKFTEAGFLEVFLMVTAARVTAMLAVFILYPIIFG